MGTHILKNWSLIKLFKRFILLLALGACSTPENEVNISGEVKFATRGAILFQRLYPDSLVTIDTVQLRDNRYFKFSTPVDEPDYYSLDFFGKQRVNLILNKDDIHMIVDGNDPFGEGEINGSQEHSILFDFKDLIDSLSSSSTEKLLKFHLKKAIIEKNIEDRDSIQEIGTEWYYEKQQIYKKFWSNQKLTLD